MGEQSDDELTPAEETDNAIELAWDDLCAAGRYPSECGTRATWEQAAAGQSARALVAIASQIRALAFAIRELARKDTRT